MTQPTIPQRFDVVGSFLRPAELKEARRAFQQGEIDAAALKAVEDKAIRALIDQQIAHGLHYVSDGELRRSWWHLDFFWGFDGVEKVSLEHGYRFHDQETRAESARLVAPLGCTNHPYIEHFLFVKDAAGDRAVPKLAIPAPAQFYNELMRPENIEATNAIYPNRDDLLTGIVEAYRAFIEAFYKVGGRVLQLDDCTWGTIVDEKFIKTRVALAQGKTAEEIIDLMGETLLSLNNRVLANQPDDLIINTHVCRGNYHSTWAASGGYAPIADYLFAREDVNAFYLEFDTERAGNFEPLAKVGEDKAVVLGLVTSKTPELEDADALLARLEEATQYVPKERLLLSPQCGFASTEEGNKLTEEEQWKKVDLVREVAERFWGK